MEPRHPPSYHYRRLLECSICFEQFRNPKELDCQHTFCESPCLEQLENAATRKLQCPLCRFEQAVPEDGVGTLKTNRIIKDLIDLCKDQQRGCEVCCSNEITTECLHCAKDVCAECMTRHTTHMLLDVQQLASRIAEEATVPLVKLETHTYYGNDLQISVTGLKAKINHSIEDIVNQLKQKGRELDSELDLHLACELSNLECLEEKCLKWSNILETCREAKLLLSGSVSQEFMNAIRKKLHEAYIAMPIEIGMPKLSTVQIQLRKASVLESIELYGTITSDISGNEQPPLKSDNALPSCQNTRQFEGSPENSDAAGAVSNPHITIQGTPGTSDATGVVSDPHITIQGTPGTSDAPGAVSSPDITIQGTFKTNDVYHSLSCPRKTIRSTATHQFFSITSLAISPVNGDIAVCDTGRHIITLFTSTGRFMGEIGGFGRKPGSLNEPRGVTYNPEGQIVIADTLNHRIQIFDKTWHLKETFSQKGKLKYDVNAPCDVAATENVIWVCDQGNNKIKKFSGHGGPSPGNNITARRFQNPTKMCYDNMHGVVYVMDTNGIHYFEPVDNAEAWFRQRAAADLGEYRNMWGNSAIAISEDGHLIYSTTPTSLAICDKNGILIKSFVSNEATATHTAIMSVAITNGCVVVAGSNYLEIYSCSKNN